MVEKQDLLARIKKGWYATRYWVNEYFGQNDYQRYKHAWKVAHFGKEVCDEGHHLMTPGEYYQYKLEVRYGASSSRCC